MTRAPIPFDDETEPLTPIEEAVRRRRRVVRIVLVLAVALVIAWIAL